MVTNEVHVYKPADWNAGFVDKCRLEGITSFSLSPGRNPSLAAFVGEKKVNCLAMHVSSKVLTVLSCFLRCLLGSSRVSQDLQLDNAFERLFVKELLQGGQNHNEMECCWD
jgi:hypothetical protein